MLPWIVAACLTRAATAHHSTAEFDYTRQLTIKGTVKEVQWTNPHSYIQLIADGERGEKVQWSVEFGSPSLNVHMGWRKDSVKVGDAVTMNLSPARNGKPYGTLRVITFTRRQAAGRRGGAGRGRPRRCAARTASRLRTIRSQGALTMRRLYHWSLLLAVAAVAAGASGAAERTGSGSSAAGPAALLGIWVPDAAPRALLTSSGKAPPLTAAASKLYAERRQRLAKGDASFDPTTWCAGPGMPRILTMQYPLEIRADASRIVFIHGWYRWFRTVDMGAGRRGSPAAADHGIPGGALGGKYPGHSYRRVD